MNDPSAQQADQALQVIPLIEEELVVKKRTVQVGTVRLRKHTEEHVESVEVPLTTVSWNVEHVPVERVVGERPEPRQVGETTIYSIVEERLIVTRELVVREEVHVTRSVTTQTEVTQHVVLREVLSEERLAEPLR